jgi:hypothetical protein
MSRMQATVRFDRILVGACSTALHSSGGLHRGEHSSAMVQRVLRGR